jgi:hypothetical protein
MCRKQREFSFIFFTLWLILMFPEYSSIFLLQRVPEAITFSLTTLAHSFGSFENGRIACVLFETVVKASFLSKTFVRQKTFVTDFQ